MDRLALLVSGLLAASLAAPTLTLAETRADQTQAANTAAVKKPAAAPVRNLPNRFAGRAGHYYRMVWGIDSLSVKWAESGELVRVSWRVLEPAKAAVLNNKNVEPSLIDPPIASMMGLRLRYSVSQGRHRSLLCRARVA